MTSRQVRNIAIPVALAGIVVVVGYFVFRGAGDGTVIASPRQKPGSRVASVVSHERLTGSEKYLPLGRVRLDVVSRHPTRKHWGGRTVRWSLGAGANGRLKRVKTGRARETTPGVTRMTTVLTLPHAGPFRFAARGPGGSHYVGAGIAPVGYPPRPAIESAAAYLGKRTGYTAFAVIDSEGRMHGSHIHRTFVTASVVKAMLLVAYLRMIAGAHGRLAETDRSLLQSMIHISDNDAATDVWERDGDQRLRALARRAGMTDFSIEGEWGDAQLSAADQARYFFEMDSLIPARFRHLADHLLSHITGYESWGIPAVARPRGWTVYFKGGWRGTERGQLVHQIARLRKPHDRVAIAVMTDGDPSMEYGIETIQGVAARLLPRRSGAAP
jgi:hypothetical protein